MPLTVVVRPLMLILLLTGLTIDLSAQLNESDTLRLQLRAGLGGRYQTGNVRLLLLRGSLEGSAQIGEQLVFKTQNSQLYQEFSGFKVDNYLLSQNYLYYRPWNRIYPLAIAYLSSDFRRRIDGRYFMGLGGTWQLVRAESHTVKLSMSLFYEQSRFRTTSYNLERYNGQQEVDLWRGTVYLQGLHRLFDSGLLLHYTAYWMPALSDADNFRVVLDAGADLRIWKGLFVQLAYNFSHENLVAERVRQQDGLLTFGLNYQLRVR